MSKFLTVVLSLILLVLYPIRDRVKYIVSFVLLVLTFQKVAWAALPIDIVFDLDQTILTLVHEGPKGDLLADPSHPLKGTVSVEFLQDGFLTKERYRFYDGMTDLMKKLKSLQEKGQVRVSFFSGGAEERNIAVLKAIALDDGSSLLDLSQGRVYSRHHMKPTGLGPDFRIRQRFKKDLTVVNRNLDDLIIVEDIHEFVTPSQRAHVLWIDEGFPYPERVWDPERIFPTEEMIRNEKEKFSWIQEKIMMGIDERLKTGRSFSSIMQDSTGNGTITPLQRRGCTSTQVFKVLENLLLR